MTITAPQPNQPTRRDRWGRYLVVPPTGASPAGYVRATTVAKTLDDQSNLMQWSGRMGALGFAARPDLLAMVSAVGDDPKALNELCERAKEAGGATVRRDLGTALHAMLEQSWTVPGYTPPPAHVADVEAVHQALELAGLRTVGLFERIVVNDTHRIAGTFDLIVADAADTLYVADIKTGSSVQYGALGFAIQLYIYATADAIYTQGAAADGSEDVREAMPQVSTGRGLIIHVEPGSGRCDLHWLDLTIGAEALALALAVRDIRKTKPITPVEQSPAARLAKVNAVFPGTVDVTPTAKPDLVDDEWREWMTARIRTVADAGHLEQLAHTWPVDLPTLASGDPITVADGERIAALVDAVEAAHEMPFNDPAPGSLTTVKPRPLPAQYVTPDEGATVTVTAVRELNDHVATLQPDAIEWFLAVVDAAHRAGRDIRMTGRGAKRSERRHAIATALAAIAPHTDNDLAYALVAAVTGNDHTDQSLGRIVGSLTIEEAQRLHKLANAVDDLTVTVAYDDDGSLRLVGDIHAATAA